MFRIEMFGYKSPWTTLMVLGEDQTFGWKFPKALINDAA